jgi:hypothetical protein
MNALTKYVYDNTERGECKCGKCIDSGNSPDPTGHTIDMVFFKVAVDDGASIDTFKELTEGNQDGDFCSLNPLDGKEHNYMELGAWIGDQGLAMMYMALGVSVGAFTLLSPSMLGLSGPDALQLAGMGMLAIQVKKDQVEVAA